MSQNVELVPVCIEQHAQLLYDWRRDPEISRYMYTPGPDSYDQHLNWLRQVEKDASHIRFVAESRGVPVGTAVLSNVDRRHLRAELGMYIGEVSARIRGVGAAVEFLILNYAFAELELQKVSCEVYNVNEAAIRMHKRMGFSVEGVLRRHAKFEDQWVDVTRLAIFREEWEAAREMLKPLFKSLL